MSNDIARAIQRASFGMLADDPLATIVTEMRHGPCIVASRTGLRDTFVTEIRADFMPPGNGDSPAFIAYSGQTNETKALIRQAFPGVFDGEGA